MNQPDRQPSDRRVVLVSTAAAVVGAVASVMQWLTSAGAGAVVAVGLVGLGVACWALAWLWIQRRPVLATVVVLILVVLAAVTGAATDRIVGRGPAAGNSTAAPTPPTPNTPSASVDPTTPAPKPTPSATSTSVPSGTPRSPSGTPSATPSTGPSTPSRTADDVTLSTYYPIDLDSTAPNWNVRSGYSLGPSADLLLTTGAAPVQTPGDVVVIDGAPSAVACEESITRQNNIDRRQIKTGQSFCVRTTETRWAWLTVKRYEPDATITFDIIVW